MINIANRSTKPIISNTQAWLDPAIASFRKKTGNVWLTVRRSVCTHFIMSLTSRTHRKLQTGFAPKTHRAKEKTLTPIRKATSATWLFISTNKLNGIVKNKTMTAKTKISTGMKKALSFAETKVRESKKIVALRRQSAQVIQIEEAEQLNVETETEFPIEASHAEPPSIDSQELPTSTVITTPSNPAIITKLQVSQETPTECLTCEKLIHCDLRTSISTLSFGQDQEGPPCPFAIGLSGNAKQTRRGLA